MGKRPAAFFFVDPDVCAGIVLLQLAFDIQVATITFGSVCLDQFHLNGLICHFRILKLRILIYDNADRESRYKALRSGDFFHDKCPGIDSF